MSQASRLVTKYSYREYECFPNDGFRHEIVDGVHFKSPAPSTKHQKVSRKIHFPLYSQIEQKSLGEVYNAPTDVELSEHDIVQPDIIVVLREQLDIITSKKIHGIPALVVEILSESNRRYDQVLKFEMYQKSGVFEYWIVDTVAEMVQQFVLVNDRYADAGTHHKIIAPKYIAGVEIDLLEAWI